MLRNEKGNKMQHLAYGKELMNFKVALSVSSGRFLNPVPFPMIELYCTWISKCKIQVWNVWSILIGLCYLCLGKPFKLKPIWKFWIRIKTGHFPRDFCIRLHRALGGVICIFGRISAVSSAEEELGNASLYGKVQHLETSLLVEASKCGHSYSSVSNVWPFFRSLKFCSSL